MVVWAWYEGWHRGVGVAMVLGRWAWVWVWVWWVCVGVFDSLNIKIFSALNFYTYTPYIT